MRCPYCRWTGPFKSYGGHMARSHRRIMLKNLKKAHSPAAKRKAAATRRRNLGLAAKEHKGSRKHHPGGGAHHRGHYCSTCGKRCTG